MDISLILNENVWLRYHAAPDNLTHIWTPQLLQAKFSIF